MTPLQSIKGTRHMDLLRLCHHIGKGDLSQSVVVMEDPTTYLVSG